MTAERIGKASDHTRKALSYFGLSSSRLYDGFEGEKSAATVRAFANCWSRGWAVVLSSLS